MELFILIVGSPCCHEGFSGPQKEVALLSVLECAHGKGGRRFQIWRFLLLAASVSLVLVVCAPRCAWAEDDSISSDEDWSPSVSIDFDSESYGPSDKIGVTVTGVNDKDEAMLGASVSASIPEGYSVVEGTVEASTQRIEPGESLSVNFAMKRDAAVSGAVGPVALAKTGDGLSGLVGIISLVVVFAMFAVLASRRKGIVRHAKSMGGKTVCLVVAASLVASQAAILPSTAFAHPQGAKGEVESFIEVGGSPVAVSASFTVSDIEASDADAVPQVSVRAQNSVAKGSNVSEIVVVSNPVEAIDFQTGGQASLPAKEFSDSIDAECVTLGQGFSSCKVESVRKLDSTTIVLTVAGTVDSGEEDGSVLLSPRSFVEALDTDFGELLVSIEEPSATIERTEDGYNEATGLFEIPIALSAAQFSSSLSADQFSVPGDGGVVVDSVDRVDGAQAVLVFSVSGSTPTERFQTLNSALTERGVEIDEAALNCGSLTAVSEDVSQAFGKGATALGYVEPIGAASVSGWQYEPTEQGGMVALRIDVSSIVGAFSEEKLSSVGVWFDDECEGDCLVDEATFSIDGDALLTLRIPVAQATVDAFSSVQEDGSSVLDEETLCEVVAWSVASHDLILDGSFLNEWGIAEPELQVPFAMMAEDDGVSLLSNGGGAASDLKKAQNAIQVTRDVLSVVSNAIKIVIAENPGAVTTSSFDCVSSLLGLVSDVAGITMGGEQYTLSNVMAKLDGMDAELRTVSSQVDALSIQMASLDADVKYSADVKQFSTLLSRVASYDKTIERAMQTIDPDDTATDFSKMTEANKTTLANLKSGISTTESLNGTTVYRDFSDLTSYILGNGTIASQSIVDEYFGYVDTFYNWAPETFLAKTVFLDYVARTYQVGYSATMADLAVKISEAKDEETVRTLNDQRETVVENYQKVISLLFGEVNGNDGSIAESTFYQETHDRADGLVLNLVDGELYLSESVVTDDFGNRRPLSLSEYLGFKVPDGDLSSFGNIAIGNSTFKLSELQTMQKRLNALRAADPSYSDKASLADEMKAVGVIWETEYAKANFSIDKNSVIYKDGSVYRYLVSDVTCNQSGKERYWYGDVFDISTGVLEQNAQIVYGHEWTTLHKNRAWYVEAVSLQPPANPKFIAS